MIVGKDNHSQVGTLVERTTLFVALVKLENFKAENTSMAFSRILNRFQSQLRRSLTYDQGTEMCHHKLLTQASGAKDYFAHPHSHWERGIWRTPMGCCANIYPEAQTCPCFLSKNWMTFRGCSIPGHGKLWAGKHQQNSSCPKEHSISCNTGLLNHNPLHLDVESAHRLPGTLTNVRPPGGEF